MNWKKWDRVPSWSDPRLPFGAIQLVYLLLGISYLGFNRSPLQITVTISACIAIDMTLHYFLRGRRLLFPLSAAISGIGLGLLLNYSHGIWWPLLPVFISIASKYLITFEERHVFNPTLFGVVITLFYSHGMISSAAPYQWGGPLAASLFIVTGALVLFVGKIKKNPLIISFLIFYTIATALRALIMRSMIPPETLFISTVSSPAFYLFTFFMITDPATSPKGARGQIFMAFFIVLVDFILQTRQMFSTFFIAGFLYYSLRFIWLHAERLWQARDTWSGRLRFGFKRVAALSLTSMVAYVTVVQVTQASATYHPDFQLVKMDIPISAHPSDLTNQVDPRIANVGKWLMSIGDAVAVGDFDNDGLQDLFFSNSLKAPDDRGTLYRNLGDFKFEKVDLPALDDLRHDPKNQGYIAGGLWFDYDNDGDKDLLVLVGYGRTRLLKNMLKETGKATFVDVSDEAGLVDYTISVAANVLDIDRDGKLDLVLGNAFAPQLPGYNPPVNFNPFKLPEPAYPGDRRMFNVMNRGWHNADNGGGLYFYKGDGKRFTHLKNSDIGITGQRWNLDIGTGDLDRDGWTDLYIANDFGADQLFMNQKGMFFSEVHGNLFGEMGRDTYKGMNASVSDFDNNGYPDIYVSNMHEKLQAEGSLLWMNDGSVRTHDFRAFHDEATERNALNERRFGWGAGAGDLNRDGKLDIVQANGYLDDHYDHKYEGTCPDYWYFNSIVALSSPDIHGYSDMWADLRGRCLFPKEQNRVYMNMGSFFVDVADQVGVTEMNAARGVALVDLDNDGDLDVIITRMTDVPLIYRNDSKNENSWLGLQMVGNGTTCNRDAVGTEVVVEYLHDQRITSQYREVQGKNGLSSQGDQRLFFGLGDFKGEVTVNIHWCGDQKNDRRTFSLNGYHTVQQ